MAATKKAAAKKAPAQRVHAQVIEADARIASRKDIPDDRYFIIREAGSTGVGRDVPWTKEQEGRFLLTEEMPGYAMLKLGVTDDPGTPNSEKMRAILILLRSSVEPEDFPRLEEYLLTSQPAVGLQELTGLIEKLVEKVAERPTEPSA